MVKKREPDRNYLFGGRSFYFFDFDDNIAVLGTPLILFHRKTRAELLVSSAEFASIQESIGSAGPYAEYELDFCDSTGSFRHFRDRNISELEALAGHRQVFIEDLAHALGFPDWHWQGPSWKTFYHAVFNERPVAIITARGHAPQTVIDGFRFMVERKVLPHEPNILGIFPVSHKPTRRSLGDLNLDLPTAELKRRAIRKSVELAFSNYGQNPYHRFGMSDDDPKNLEGIVQEFKLLKALYPDNAFFLIDTQKGRHAKIEVSEAENRALLEVEYCQFAPFDKNQSRGENDL